MRINFFVIPDARSQSRVGCPWVSGFGLRPPRNDGANVLTA